MPLNNACPSFAFGQSPWRRRAASQGKRGAAAAAFLTLLSVAGCASTGAASGAPAISVIKGSQLKVWGIEINAEDGMWLVNGYVDRYSATRRPLEEHVHAQVVQADGTQSACSEAVVSEWVKLKRNSTTMLSARISSTSVQSGDRIVLAVVKDSASDRGFSFGGAADGRSCQIVRPN